MCIRDRYSSKYILDFSNNKAWVQKITSIKLGGSACKPVTSADDVSSDKYYLCLLYTSELHPQIIQGHQNLNLLFSTFEGTQSFDLSLIHI